MYVAYGDNPNYQIWANDALMRIKKLTAKGKAEEQQDMAETFDQSISAGNDEED
jgi:hypothetical protein